MHYTLAVILLWAFIALFSAVAARELWPLRTGIVEHRPTADDLRADERMGLVPVRLWSIAASMTAEDDAASDRLVHTARAIVGRATA